jgi:RNA polymerase sigma-70 factor (ECF subfamily)
MAILYRQAIAEFGGALGRTAAGYEFDPHLRQDLLQEMHLALWRSLEHFRGQCSLRTWVFRVVCNVAASWIRREKRGRFLELVGLEELERIAGEWDPERASDESAVLARIESLVERLKPIDRDVVLLWLEGLSAAEIGEVLGLSAANVAQKIHRSREVLLHQFRGGKS